MLGILLHPYKNELLASWFVRLAAQNGIDSPTRFLKAYVCPQKAEKAIQNTLSCTNQYLLYFCEQCGFSLYDLLVNHTEYPAIAPFLTAYQQSKIMLSVSGVPMGSSINRFIKTANVCPECQQEQPYIRVAHNLPGVRACWKHGCSLDGMPVTQEDVAYARYAHDFWQAHIDCDIKQLMRFTNRRGANLSRYIGFENGIWEVMKVVSVEELKEGIGPNETAKPVAGYTILQGTGNITEFRHVCGTHFCMNANGFNLGFQCPHCQAKMTEAERFENYVEHVGRYELLSPYEGMARKVLLRHTCGKVLEIRAFDFLGGSRCRCNYYHTPQEIQNTIRQFGNFKLVKYQKERVTILHEDCGQTFTIGYKKFLLRPWCKKCKPRFLRSEETLRAEIKAIAPDFEYVGGFSGSGSSFTIRHKCGYEFQREIYEFRKNPTCPRCSKFTSGEKRQMFIRYMKQKTTPVTIREMQEYSGGSYDAAKRILQKMAELQIAERTDRGQYRLKERG